MAGWVVGWLRASQDVGDKVKAALNAGLNVIACVGETLAERNATQTLEVVTRQLKAIAGTACEAVRLVCSPVLTCPAPPPSFLCVACCVVDGIPANVDVPARVVIAYEPVWAIGTGQVATPAQAQAVHRAVREWMKSGLGSAAVANAVRVIYGGNAHTPPRVGMRCDLPVPCPDRVRASRRVVSGSVSKDNCDTLMVEPDIDGFLVGGASLKAADFCHIMQCPARQIVSKKPSAAAAAAPSAAAAADPK